MPLEAVCKDFSKPFFLETEHFYSKGKLTWTSEVSSSRGNAEPGGFRCVANLAEGVRCHPQPSAPCQREQRKGQSCRSGVRRVAAQAEGQRCCRSPCRFGRKTLNIPANERKRAPPLRKQSAPHPSVELLIIMKVFALKGWCDKKTIMDDRNASLPRGLWKAYLSRGKEKSCYTLCKVICYKGGRCHDQVLASVTQGPPVLGSQEELAEMIPGPHLKPTAPRMKPMHTKVWEHINKSCPWGHFGCQNNGPQRHTRTNSRIRDYVTLDGTRGVAGCGPWNRKHVLVYPDGPKLITWVLTKEAHPQPQSEMDREKNFVNHRWLGKSGREPRTMGSPRSGEWPSGNGQQEMRTLSYTVRTEFYHGPGWAGKWSPR